MQNRDASGKESGKTIEFELSPDDLKEIAAGKSVQIPSARFFGKTTFTIENAPIPKSINDAVTIQLDVKSKRDGK
jgi:hypothetical protein